MPASRRLPRWVSLTCATRLTGSANMMPTRSIETNRAVQRLALAMAAMLAMTLATPGVARAKEGPVGADTPAATSQQGDASSKQETASLVVDANLPDPEPEAWDGFRRSVAGAATSSCFGPYAVAHQQFVVDGLLRVPFLIRAATDGSC
jgi:hypothetical protein